MKKQSQWSEYSIPLTILIFIGGILVVSVFSERSYTYQECKMFANKPLKEHPITCVFDFTDQNQDLYYKWLNAE